LAILADDNRLQVDIDIKKKKKEVITEIFMQKGLGKNKNKHVENLPWDMKERLTSGCFDV
jgi:hypothetical protein